MKKRFAIIFLTGSFISSTLVGCGMTADRSSEAQTEGMTTSEESSSAETTAAEEITTAQETTVEETTVAMTETKAEEVTSDDVNNWIYAYRNSNDRTSMSADGGVISDEWLKIIAPYKEWNIIDKGDNHYLAQTVGNTISIGFIKKDGALYNSEAVIQSSYCGNCGGNGGVYNGGSVCAICNGSGQQYIPNAYYDNVMGWQGQWQVCGGCGGAGHIGGNIEICPVCHGYGSL